MSEWFCPHCGMSIYDDEAILCHNCGNSLEKRSGGLMGFMRSPWVMGIVIAVIVLSFVLISVF